MKLLEIHSKDKNIVFEIAFEIRFILYTFNLIYKNILFLKIKIFNSISIDVNKFFSEEYEKNK